MKKSISSLMLVVAMMFALSVPAFSINADAGAPDASEETPATANYLTFTAEEDGSTIKFGWVDGSDFQISDDGSSWFTCLKGRTRTLYKGESVYLKGTNVTTDISNHFTINGKVAASGSVTSLTDGVGNDRNVSLADSCYDFMFYNCTGLTTAPELPATTLADSCYDHMFVRCTGLTTAPELPATTLASHCYAWMFDGCTSLTTAPELPATKLASYCYFGMFNNCTKLTTAPKLPATTLADSCYFRMFLNCVSLTTAPELPATALARNCYKEMFGSCTGLTTAPELPATKLASYCYYRMFNGCSGISLTDQRDDTHRKPWTIEPENEPTDCVTDMFANTGSSFPTPELNKTYYLPDPASVTPTDNSLAGSFFSSLSFWTIPVICIGIAAIIAVPTVILVKRKKEKS